MFDYSEPLDRPSEACGVFGVFARDVAVARMTFFGLFALQHRGQESAGIAVSDGYRATLHKEMGLVSQVFNEDNLRPLQGHIAIGHVRYSTADSSRQVSAQPFMLESMIGPVALAHNGNLVNTGELRQELFTRGVGLTSFCDTEVMVQIWPAPGRHLVGAHPAPDAQGGGRLFSHHPDPRRPLCRPRPLGLSPPEHGAHQRWLGGGLGELCPTDRGRHRHPGSAAGMIVVIDDSGARLVQGVPPTSRTSAFSSTSISPGR